MECIGQFVGEVATRGLIDEGLDGGDESAVAGKPNRILGPQAGVVEASGFAEGIVAAAVGIVPTEKSVWSSKVPPVPM